MTPAPTPAAGGLAKAGSVVVAVVAAYERADTIAGTVTALRAIDGVARVVVVDDGSSDATSERAAAAGAHVERLPANAGKGAAVAAGVERAIDADVYLLIDADVGATAAAAAALLQPVVDGTADMTVGVLPPAGGRGGFGWVKRLAATGIARATGFTPRAPLSGQRAVRGELLRSLLLADRFGLEVGLTIDALRAGRRVVEVDVSMDHRHTGRRVSGFRHRAGQGVDIVRALWPRLTTARARLALMLAVFVVASGLAVWSGGNAEPSSVAATRRASKVVIFGIPHLGLDDVAEHRLPNLDRLLAEGGAIAATSVRTQSGRPTTTEGYATLGAGTRVRAGDHGGYAFDADARLEGGTAAQALERRTGVPVSAADAKVAVVGGAATIAANRGRHLTALPGELGVALERAGKRAAVIGNADTGYLFGDRSSLLRPAAVAVMDRTGAVPEGTVGRELLIADADAPFGYRANRAAVLDVFDRAMATSDVVLVDPGDTDRAAEFAPVASPEVAARYRNAALAATDGLLGEIRARLPDDALLLVVSVTPPTREWRLTPTVAAGAGVVPGYLHSPSTRRLGVVTLTDLAPTVLDALGAPVPDGMIGHPLRFHPTGAASGRATPADAASGRATPAGAASGRATPADAISRRATPAGAGPNIEVLRRIDRDAAYRESIYLPLTITFIVVQAIVYLLAIVAFGRMGGSGRARRPLRLVVLAIAAYPLATFLMRAVPGVARLGGAGVLVVLAIDVAIVALATRARRHPLSPLAWVLFGTVALLCLDVATGARLQTSSLLGYSLHTAARFTGFGNTAFATLAATTVLLGAIHVHHAPRRQEALVAVAFLFAFVVLCDGAPALGADVGGILTLVPVFGLTLLVLSGRRLSWRAVAVAAGVTAFAIVLATGIDLLRPVDSRTHLGRLVADMQSDGFGVFGTTLSRKVAANFRTYGSTWSWSVVIIALYMLYVLGWTRGWHDLLPARSALRAGVVGALAAGLLGYAVNDSGVVVTAVVFVYLGPFLTFLALRREDGERARIEPLVRAPSISATG